MSLIKPEFNKFKIKKQSGGMRTIYVNTNPLETNAQEDLIILKSHEIIQKYNIQNIPLAYTRKVSVEHHIKHHLKNNYFIKMDIKNFFESCPIDDEIKPFIHSEYYIDAESKTGMRQGSRISGDVTNATLAKHLDSKIPSNITYSRYADDILISADNFEALSDAYKEIESLLKEIGLKLNKKKTKRIDLSDPRFHLKFLGYNITKSKRDDENLYVSISRRKRNKWTHKNRQNHLEKVLKGDR